MSGSYSMPTSNPYQYSDTMGIFDEAPDDPVFSDESVDDPVFPVELPDDPAFSDEITPDESTYAKDTADISASGNSIPCLLYTSRCV